jgi:transcriptional regulator with XRE-family HTH domain
MCHPNTVHHFEARPAGLSQEQLAEKANLARNYIGNIERAEYKVTVETLAQIAKALKVRVRDLVSDI